MSDILKGIKVFRCKKRPYSKEYAENLLRVIHGKKGRREKACYKCRLCGAYHLTSQKQRKKDGRK